VTSAILWLGIAIIYGSTGSLHGELVGTIFMAELWVPSNKLDFISMLLILSALLMKLGAAPMHYWIPDLLGVLSSKIAIWIAVLPK
jgi:NADH-quinone oxidoreductase subunit N